MEAVIYWQLAITCIIVVRANLYLEIRFKYEITCQIVKIHGKYTALAYLIEWERGRKMKRCLKSQCSAAVFCCRVRAQVNDISARAFGQAILHVFVIATKCYVCLTVKTVLLFGCQEIESENEEENRADVCFIFYSCNSGKLRI